MPYQVSMMGCVGSGEDFCGLGCVGYRNFGLGFEKVTHDQLWTVQQQAQLYERGRWGGGPYGVFCRKGGGQNLNLRCWLDRSCNHRFNICWHDEQLSSTSHTIDHSLWVATSPPISPTSPLCHCDFSLKRYHCCNNKLLNLAFYCFNHCTASCSCFLQ